MAIRAHCVTGGQAGEVMVKLPEGILSHV
jgi:hypothetical protein